MNNTLYVVETADDSFLGTIEFVPGGVVVHNGFVGRPKLVESADLVRILPAEEHPEVELDMVSEDSRDYFLVR